MRVAALAILLYAGTASAYSSRSIEWSYFNNAGYGRSAVFGAGLEASLPVLRWKGFPSGYSHDLSELRIGAFALGNTRPGGGSIEGGLLFDVSSRYHASWGTFTLRVGAGYGSFDARRLPEGSITVLYGVRSVLSKYGSRHVPRWYNEASLLRVFGTYRRALREEGQEWIFGIEMSPTFFFPPVTWWRLAGGPPH
jgi:hypothetical protein